MTPRFPEPGRSHVEVFAQSVNGDASRIMRFSFGSLVSLSLSVTLATLKLGDKTKKFL
jgi:hypothetical protein